MQAAESVILLVDESQFFLTMEKQFLRKVPATVLEAQSAAQALEICRTTPPHLIYLAKELPDQDGAACCQAVKNNPALTDVPVILVCEQCPPSEKEICRHAGCSGVLTKPLERNRFLEAGRKFLPGIRERRRTCLIGVNALGNSLQLEGKGLDISSGGVFFETSEKLAIGIELQFELHLARPKEVGPKIRCTGAVAWANTRVNPIKPEHPVGYGIKFTNFPPQYVDALGNYLRRLDENH